MKKLERSLGLWQVVVVGFSAMLGTGIFVAPGIIYNVSGPSIVLAYLLGAILVLPAAISMSELATSMPTSGGIYVYADRAFGPLVGTIVGFGLWLSLLFKTAFALKGFGEYLSVFSSFSALWTSLFMLLLILILNIGGVSKVASSLAFIVSLCLVAMGGLSFLSMPNINPGQIDEIFLGGGSGFIVAISLAIGAFAGLTKLTAIAEEVQNPEINLPRGILFSLFGVAAIYIAVSLLLVFTLSHEELAGNLKPLFTLANSVVGQWGGKFLAVMAILTLISMANAGILAASRFPFAMARDRLLPKIFGRLHNRFLTPIWSIVLSGLVIALIILALNTEKVAKFASVFIIQMFILVNIIVIALRESGVQWYKPKYRSRLYPALHTFGIISGFILLFYMGKLTIFSLIIVGVPGLIIYSFYGIKATRLGVVGIKGKRSDLLNDSEMKSGIICLETIDNFNQAKVVVPLFGQEQSPETLAEMAHALSQGNGVEVVHVTEVPEQTQLDDMEDPVGLKALRRRIMVMSEEKKGITFDAVATHDLTKTLFEIGQRVQCDWLLLDWSGKRSGRMTFDNPIGWIKNHLSCHVAFYSDKGVRNFRKILVIIKGAAGDKLVLETANILAEINHAMITVVKEKNLNSQFDFEDERLMIENFLVTQHNMGHRVQVQDIDYDESALPIVNLSVDFDLLIFGKDSANAFQSFMGTRDDLIIDRAACAVLRLNMR